jgi:hypothetical protein
MDDPIDCRDTPTAKRPKSMCSVMMLFKLLVFKQAHDINNSPVAWKFCAMEKNVRCWMK